MPDRVDKVVAYITHGHRLLVFSHPDSPQAGIQVPAGTIEENEPPDKAVLREAFEETGLPGLKQAGFLGECDFDVSAYGRDQIQHRYFFHLEFDGDAPTAWRHNETDGGNCAPIVFEFFWVPIRDGIPQLIAGQGAMLPALFRKLRKET